jgi:hypothetical protein
MNLNEVQIQSPEPSTILHSFTDSTWSRINEEDIKTCDENPGASTISVDNDTKC